MKIKIVEKRIIEPPEDGQKMKDKTWPAGANAFIFMGGNTTFHHKHATIVCEGLRSLSNGW